MAYNNLVKLTGNLGSDTKVLNGEKAKFAVISLATTDSYKEKESGEWKNKETTWHQLIVFKPSLIEKVSKMKKGTRIYVEGYLSYKPIESTNEADKKIKRQEAAIIAFKIQEAPLLKKDERQK